ncbi:MAG: DEAD/DEAH box helicase [Gammaproteobacteria bacterium]|nr:DEAD/DEAH box helicase [Gammaproteobacteria bacterium]
MISLRPYQSAGIAQIREAFGVLRKRAPLYVLPTGGGKTLTFATIAHGAAAKGNRVYILSHRVELVDQISDALDISGTPHGYIAAGYPKYKHACMIASVPTLLRRLDKVAPPDLIVVDEAHHSVSSTWARILTHWPNAKLLGVTATPLRASGEGLGKIFDHLIVGPSIADLTAQGYLAAARVFAPPTVDTSGLHTRAGDFVAKESEALLDTPSVTGDALSHYRKHADGLPALAFCVSVRHAKHLAEQFRAAGYPAMELDGGTAREVRRGAVSDFRAGRIKVLTSCDLFSEGFDCPGVHVGIMLRPTQSLALHCQQIGRILRPCEGKTHAIILDHAGNTQRHGLPDTAREWTLDGEDRAPKKKSISVKVCPACWSALPPTRSRCDQCGFEFVSKPREIDEREGELAEITPEMIAKRQERREQGMAHSLEALREIARRKGYAPQWADHVWNARQKKARRA